MSKATFKKVIANPAAAQRRDVDILEQAFPLKEIMCAVYDAAERGEREARIDSMYQRLTGERRPHAKTAPIRTHIFGKSYDPSLSKIRRHIFGGSTKGGE